MNKDAGWMEVWENVGRPFFTTCIVVYVLTFVVWQVTVLLGW